MVERTDDYGGEVAEGENAAEANLARCFEGQEGNGQEVEVVIVSERSLNQ